MKGIFIHNGIEYRLETPETALHQGGTLHCIVAVKNAGTQQKSVSSIVISLIVQKKTGKQAETPDEPHVLLKDVRLEPGGQAKAEWVRPLPEDFVISDRSHVPSLRFGCPDDSGSMQTLALTILPHPHIIQLVELLGSSFGFSNKGVKFSSGWVETKLKPSSDRRLSLVDEMMLGAKIENGSIFLRYDFKVKKLEASAASVKFQKGRRTIDQTLAEGTYLLTPERIDTAVAEKYFAEALETVSAGF